MKTEKKKSEEEGHNKERSCLAFCGAQAIDGMMAKCCESMGGVEMQGMAEMMGKGCAGMSEATDWSKRMKIMCSKWTKKTKT